MMSKRFNERFSITRIKLLNEPLSQLSLLTIRNVNSQDFGKYECRVNVGSQEKRKFFSLTQQIDPGTLMCLLFNIN